MRLVATEDAETPLNNKNRFTTSGNGMHLLHVVGQVTDELLGFLGPAMRTLASNGHSQRIVVMDVPQYQHNIDQFEGYATVIRIANASNLFSRWKNIFQACKSELTEQGISAVHAHGLLPFVLISAAMRSTSVEAPVLYPPHGSRSLGTLRFIGKFALLAARFAVKHDRISAIVTMPQEMGGFEQWQIADVIETPVDNVFFSVSHREAKKPLVVTGGKKSSIRSIEIFSQLSVLLSGEELGVNFNWLGTVPATGEQRLQAADVSVTSISNDRECAEAMSAGWMYVAPCSNRGFPLFLARAMAIGLPIVALDCELHREVIEDGKAGFLCSTEQEMVSKIALLIDNPTLRKKMGAAARAAAEDRFSNATFEDKLLTAYSTL